MEIKTNAFKETLEQQTNLQTLGFLFLHHADRASVPREGLEGRAPAANHYLQRVLYTFYDFYDPMFLSSRGRCL